MKRDYSDYIFRARTRWKIAWSMKHNNWAYIRTTCRWSRTMYKILKISLITIFFISETRSTSSIRIYCQHLNTREPSWSDVIKLESILATEEQSGFFVITQVHCWNNSSIPFHGNYKVLQSSNLTIVKNVNKKTLKRLRLAGSTTFSLLWQNMNITRS